MPSEFYNNIFKRVCSWSGSLVCSLWQNYLCMQCDSRASCFFERVFQYVCTMTMWLGYSNDYSLIRIPGINNWCFHVKENFLFNLTPTELEWSEVEENLGSSSRSEFAGTKPKLNLISFRCGYATLHHVVEKTKEDRMESFFLSETCKYLYLVCKRSSFLLQVLCTKWHNEAGAVRNRARLWGAEVFRCQSIAECALLSLSLP